MAAPGHIDHRSTYHAFLLRFTRACAGRPWDLVAKDVESGEEYPLVDLDALIAFLAERTPIFDAREPRPRLQKEDRR